MTCKLDFSPFCHPELVSGSGFGFRIGFQNPVLWAGTLAAMAGDQEIMNSRKTLLYPIR
jgi:hypothetical protein